MSYELSTADRIWNRAAADLDGEQTSPGDRALAALLLAHGLIMNGGILHALEVLSREQFERACDGYRFFGLADVATLLAETAAAAPEHDAADTMAELEHRVDETYGLLIPNDATLAAAFERHLESNPAAYAPL